MPNALARLSCFTHLGLSRPAIAATNKRKEIMPKNIGYNLHSHPHMLDDYMTS